MCKRMCSRDREGEECIRNGKSFCTSFVLSSVRFGLYELICDVRIIIYNFLF